MPTYVECHYWWQLAYYRRYGWSPRRNWQRLLLLHLHLRERIEFSICLLALQVWFNWSVFQVSIDRQESWWQEEWARCWQSFDGSNWSIQWSAVQNKSVESVEGTYWETWIGIRLEDWWSHPTARIWLKRVSICNRNNNHLAASLFDKHKNFVTPVNNKAKRW